MTYQCWPQFMMTHEICSTWSIKPKFNKSFQWGSNICPGRSCLCQYGQDCTSMIRDSSCTKMQWKAWLSEKETLSNSTESNTILQQNVWQQCPCLLNPQCNNVTFCHEFHTSRSHTPRVQLPCVQLMYLLHCFIIDSPVNHAAVN